MHGTCPNLPAKPPAPLRALARERRPSGRRPVTHIALPGYEIARAVPRRRETITALLRRTGWARRDAEFGWQFRIGLPTILTINGEPVLRKRWRSTRIGAADVVQFVSRPLGGQRGGTGKQVIGLVALIAVAAFAAWAGPVAAGAIGLTGKIAEAVGYGLTAAIGLGGSLLINSLTAPKQGATNDPNATTDQIYTASASGNLPKLGQPLPIGYGREKVYPDFAATPWGEFVGNDQYQNILLSVGLGKYSYEELLVDDTPMWTPAGGVAAAFSSAQVAFYNPGETVTLFPTSVASSSEVTGQQLPHGAGVTGLNPTTPGDWIGGYIANAPGTSAYKLAIDFALPAGCFLNGSKGETFGVTVSLRAEYRPVNAAGAPTGSWAVLYEGTRGYVSRSPIRDSVVVDVPDGRYEVRFRRNDGVPDSSKGASDVIWAGLRAYLRGASTFPVSTIAIRIKGTESTQGSFKFGAIRTRILPVWNGSAFVEQPTRNNGWAFLDAVTNTGYGGGLSLSKADFQSIVAFAAGCDARGDHFDYTFTSAVAAPEAFDKILTPARARHFWLGDTISVVRDEWRDVPTMLLTDREIVRDSLQVGWTMLGDDDPDAVILEYIDEDTWRPAQVQYPPEVAGGFHATKPETKRIDGILNRAHAYREVAFIYLQSIYRRENVQLATEYEGRAITFGSVLRVQSDLPMSYGQGGAVIGRSGNALTLSPAPGWADPGNHYIRLRRPNGKVFGPVLATKGATDDIAVLDSGSLATAVTAQGIALSDVLARADGGEDPSFELGTADNQSRLCVLLSGQPNGSQCTLSLVVDDPRVHATDLGSPPVLPTAQFPSDLAAPLIKGLAARFGQGIAEPMLSASWSPAPGAAKYIAQVSYDSGLTWLQVYEGTACQFSAVVPLSALMLRVQAIGQLPGPFAQLSLATPTIEVAPGAVSFDSLVGAVQTQMTSIVDDLRGDVFDALNQIATASGERAVKAWNETNTVRFQMSARFDAASASIEQVRSAYVAADAAMATDITTIKANVAANAASIVSEALTRANADSALSATITSLTSTVNSNTAAISSEALTRANADSAISATVSSLSSTVSSNTAAISAESATRASADSALSASLSSLSTTVGSNSASISTLTTSVNGVAVKYGVTGTINGTTGGFQFTGIQKLDGSVSYGVEINGSLVVSQSLTAAKIATGTLTSDSGVFGSLGVKTMSLADNAVTVTQVATFPSQTLSSSLFTYASMTFSVDTTGLSGKVIPIVISAFWEVNYTSSSGAAFLFINGSSPTGCSVGWSGTGGGRYPFLYVYNLTATGAVQTFNISFQASSTLTGGGSAAVSAQAIAATAGKR